MSPEKNFETYEDQHRHRGKLENTEKDIPDFLVDFYDGFWIMEKSGMDEHEEDKLCQELDDFSAAKRRDVNILLLRKVRIVVFLWFMARALHVWAKNPRGKLSP